jgi:hypothetical protein
MYIYTLCTLLRSLAVGLPFTLYKPFLILIYYIYPIVLQLQLTVAAVCSRYCYCWSRSVAIAGRLYSTAVQSSTLLPYTLYCTAICNTDCARQYRYVCRRCATRHAQPAVRPSKDVQPDARFHMFVLCAPVSPAIGCRAFGCGGACGSCLVATRSCRWRTRCGHKTS